MRVLTIDHFESLAADRDPTLGPAFRQCEAALRLQAPAAAQSLRVDGDFATAVARNGEPELLEHDIRRAHGCSAVVERELSGHLRLPDRARELEFAAERALRVLQRADDIRYEVELVDLNAQRTFERALRKRGSRTGADASLELELSLVLERQGQLPLHAVILGRHAAFDRAET